MKFHEAVAKCEGQEIAEYEPQTTEVDTTYVERRVPRHLTHLVDNLIDKFLRERGYNPEEI
jgi:hypothetical protein